MKSKIYLYIIAAVIIASIGLIIFGSFKSDDVAQSLSKNDIILYWGDGCPHCKALDEYLSSHKEIEEKIKLTRKEVYNNRFNSEELDQAAKSCNLDTKDGVGIPFLYYKGECVSGDQPIIKYLTDKTK